MKGAVQDTSSNCPFCGNGSKESFSDTLHRCRGCGLVFNSGHSPLTYDNNYFIDEYRSQYGRTYQEDFHHIYSLAEKRLGRIITFGSFSNLSALSLLDIGSALGFFLKAAQDIGIERLQGIEISEYGARYTTKEFSIPVTRASFEKADMKGSYNIISAWFFIEHCASPRMVLEKIFSSLEPGGVFAMAVPSVFGPLFRRKRGKWVATHPKDHRIDFTPKSAKRILKEVGFKKVTVLPCGIHPERVMTSSSLFFPLFARLYTIFARLTGYSDTIEVYGQK